MANSSSDPKVPIPREHGLYVVLAGAWLLGLLYADAPDAGPAIAMLAAGLSGIVALSGLRECLRSMRSTSRRRYVRYYAWWSAATGIAALAAVALPAANDPSVLWLGFPAAIVGGIYLRLVATRRSMTAQSVAGFLGASLLAPGTYIAATGSARLEESVALWLLAAFFFLGSILCVNLRIDKKASTTVTGLYFLLTIPAAVLLVAFGLLPWIAAVGIAIGSTRYLLIVFDLDRYRALSLKTIGIRETILTLLFLLANGLRYILA